MGPRERAKRVRAAKETTFKKVMRYELASKYFEVTSKYFEVTSKLLRSNVEVFCEVLRSNVDGKCVSGVMSVFFFRTPTI